MDVTETAGIEARIGEIWRELFEVDRIESGDDFFALGGDSILVTIMTMRVEQAFDIPVDPGLLFDAPVLGDYARAISAEIVA